MAGYISLPPGWRGDAGRAASRVERAREHVGSLPPKVKKPKKRWPSVLGHAYGGGSQFFPCGWSRPNHSDRWVGSRARWTVVARSVTVRSAS